MILQKGEKRFKTIKIEIKKKKKMKNWDFSKGGFQSVVLIKNLKFFHVFIFGKIRQENVFDNILERNKAFLDSKIKQLKKSKNQDFSKGVSPWFW